MTAPTHGAPIAHDVLIDLLGFDDPAQVRVTKQILTALEKISPDLMPTMLDSPFAAEILRGPDAIEDLIDELDTTEGNIARAGVLEAIGEIMLRHHPTAQAVEKLRAVVNAADTPEVAAMAARGLAIAQDAVFLQKQCASLLEDDREQQEVAARLLGYGRYEKAVPVLSQMLRPELMSIVEPVIWALGEIGAAEALPALHKMLSAFAETEDVVEAIGKIGDAGSVPQLLPLMVQGNPEQRARAAKAVASIARHNDGDLGDEDLNASARGTLEKVIDHDDHKVAVFHALVAFSLLGGTMAQSRIIKSLGGEVAPEDISAVSAFFVKKP